jgi:hypothetical protein
MVIGGSGGANGLSMTRFGETVASGFGGNYGGGGGCDDSPGSAGGQGAVRIIWPSDVRFFPNTNTGNV